MNTTDFNVDQFISGFQRARAEVRIFQRPDLAARINEIDDKIELLQNQEDTSNGDRAIGEAPATLELEQERDELTRILEESSYPFTIQALTPEERSALEMEAREAAKEEANEVAAKARQWGKDRATREGVKDPHEINEYIRREAANASNVIINREIGYRILSAALVSPELSLDEFRRVAEAMGEGQVAKLQERFYAVSSQDPEASIPKSWKSGQPEEESSL